MNMLRALLSVHLRQESLPLLEQWWPLKKYLLSELLNQVQAMCLLPQWPLWIPATQWKHQCKYSLVTELWVNPRFTNRGLSYLTAVTTITETGVQRTVSGITNANPGVVTTLTAHTYTDGQKVTFANVAGMFQINSGIWYYVDVLTPTTFALYVDQALTIPLNTTSYGVYVVSSGTVTEFAGFRNSLQSGSFIQVQGLSQVPQAGSNVEFASLPGNYYKLVTVQNLLGTQYPVSYTHLTLPTNREV